MVARWVTDAGRGSVLDAAAALNAIAGGFVGVAFLLASETAKVVQLDTATSVEYPLAPAWLLAVAVVACGLYVTWQASRKGHALGSKLELRVLLFLVGPVAVFLAISQMPGDLGPMSLFEEGQRLTGAMMLGDGAIPWRDTLLVHGPLEDGLVPGLGLILVEDSRWGHIAGSALLVTPLYWIGNYLLSAYLFRRNLLFLAGSQLVLILGWIEGIGADRMILLPLVLLGLAAVLERPTWIRTVGFMGISIAQAVLVPEAAFFSLACWLTIALRDALAGAGWFLYDEPWQRARRCLVSGASIGAALLLALAASGTLRPFVDFLLEFSRDHELTGGLPFTWGEPEYAFWVFAPLVVILVSWWYAAARLGARRSFDNRELVIGAAVLGLLLYYTKFLARADTGHLYQVAGAAFIPCLYVIYRVTHTAESWIRSRSRARPRIQHPVTIGLLLVVVVLAPLSVTTELRELPKRLSAEALAAPSDPRIGYGGDPELPSLTAAARRAITRFAGEGGVWDFTNSPVLFYYLRDADPATRYST